MREIAPKCQARSKSKPCLKRSLRKVYSVWLCIDHLSRLADGDVITLQDGSKLMVELERLKSSLARINDDCLRAEQERDQLRGLEEHLKLVNDVAVALAESETHTEEVCAKCGESYFRFKQDQRIEIAQLRAEVERLRTEYERLDELYRDRGWVNEKLQAENAQLRADKKNLWEEKIDIQSQVEARILEAQAERDEWKHRAIGGTCKILSIGDKCECSLCLRDKGIMKLKAERDAAYVRGLEQAKEIVRKELSYQLGWEIADLIQAEIDKAGKSTVSSEFVRGLEWAQKEVWRIWYEHDDFDAAIEKLKAGKP